MAYLIDANVFISAKNRHYGLDFCPAFWDWLVEKNRVGVVFSIEKVGDEVRAVEDELSVWASARGESFFLRPGQEVLPSFEAVTNWVMDRATNRRRSTRFCRRRTITLCRRRTPAVTRS